MPIDVSIAEKKLREAWFFLNALKAFRSAPSPEDASEEFDFYLSAFLGASNSVAEKLTRATDRRIGLSFTAWRQEWEDGRTDDERALLAFMREERRNEVHHWGATHDQRKGHVALLSSDDAIDLGIPGYLIIKKEGKLRISTFEAYAPFYTINDEEIPVFDACYRLCNLLYRMVEQFKADHA